MWYILTDDVVVLGKGISNQCETLGLEVWVLVMAGSCDMFLGKTTYS